MNNLPELNGRLGQQLYCCPLRMSGSTTAGPTGNRAVIYWSALSDLSAACKRYPADI